MSEIETLKKDNDNLKIQLTKLNAKLNASQEFASCVVNDLIESKTNLNLHKQAHMEVTVQLNQTKKLLEDKTKECEALLKQVEELKKPPTDCGQYSENANDEAEAA